MNERRHPLADDRLDLRGDLPPGHADPFTEDQQQALGHFQPVAVVPVDVLRDYPVLRDPDADEVAGEHRSVVSCRVRSKRPGSGRAMGERLGHPLPDRPCPGGLVVVRCGSSNPIIDLIGRKHR